MTSDRYRYITHQRPGVLLWCCGSIPSHLHTPIIYSASSFINTQDVTVYRHWYNNYQGRIQDFLKGACATTWVHVPHTLRMHKVWKLLLRLENVGDSREGICDVLLPERCYLWYLPWCWMISGSCSGLFLKLSELRASTNIDQNVCYASH
jgi:hypothetical protein